MFYYKFGEHKKAIIFLHGWGADSSSFLWLNEYLPEGYSAVFVDFPGFGKSKEPDGDYTVYDFTFELKKIIDNEEFDELILVGHSFGGRVAIKFASCYQDEFKTLKLCLVDSAGLKPKRGILYYYKIFKYKILKKKVQKNAKYNKKLSKYGSNDYKKLSNTMKQVFVNVVNEDLKNDVKKIKCQTILIWGSEDKETKLYMAKRLNKYIKNSKLLIIKNAGHFCFLDNPQEFLIILDSFIKN